MYAIVDIQGQQFKVEKEKKVFVHRLDNEEGSQVAFDKVLLVDKDGKVDVGAPTVKGASVNAKVVSHLKGDKIKVFKKKRRKGYQKLNGHRQSFTEVLIEDIVLGGTTKKAEKTEETAPKAEEKPAAPKEKKSATGTQAEKSTAKETKSTASKTSTKKTETSKDKPASKSSTAKTSSTKKTEKTDDENKAKAKPKSASTTKKPSTASKTKKSTEDKKEDDTSSNSENE